MRCVVKFFNPSPAESPFPLGFFSRSTRKLRLVKVESKGHPIPNPLHYYALCTWTLLIIHGFVHGIWKSTFLIEISGPFVADKAGVPCSLAGDNAEQGSCVSREKFSVLLQVVNGFEILVDKRLFISAEMLPLVFKVTKTPTNLWD